MAKTSSTRKRGRPPLGDSTTKRIGCAATLSQIRRWRRAARHQGVDWSQFMREALDKYANTINTATE